MVYRTYRRNSTPDVTRQAFGVEMISSVIWLKLMTDHKIIAKTVEMAQSDINLSI